MSKNKILVPVMQEIDESLVDDTIKVELILKEGSTSNYVGMAIVEFKTPVAPINAKFTIYRQTQKAIDNGHLARIGWFTVRNGNDIAYTTSTSQSGNSVYANESSFSPTWKAIIDEKVNAALVKAGYKAKASVKKKAVAKTVTAASDNEVTEDTVDAAKAEGEVF